jgi:membrane-bound ClpP family serine protease
MAENSGKFLIIFIIGIVVFSIGMALPSLEVVLLGGLLAGISGMIMLVSVAAKWK